MDDQDDRKEIEEPASGLGAIRSAYLARQEQGGASGAGGDESTASVALRGVYVSQVSRLTRRGDDAVKGSVDAGGTVLRSIYAARAVIVESGGSGRGSSASRRPAPARAAPAKKAKAKAKARPAKKAQPAKKAKARTKARSAPRRTARKTARARRR
jgi:heparin binding hemagglutinin HbhA